MTNCAKCGAELIGSRKFCAACGAPTDPSALKRDVNISGPASSPAPQINVPSTAYGPPGPPVNPFAATASPSSRAAGAPYGPPPATNANPSAQPASAVSPLAVSNALSQRGAFQQAAGDMIPPSAPTSSPTGPAPRGTGTSPPPPMAKKAPGTQLMPSIPNPSIAKPPSTGSKPPPQRTQLMDASAFVRPTPARPSTPNQPVAPPAAPPQPQPQVPYSHAQPPQVPPQVPPQAPPQAPQWGAPTFGYPPGARVNVTWSNGQRYPATVSQVSGTQCLVIFPDGQQHWVEMQYLTPA